MLIWHVVFKDKSQDDLRTEEGGDRDSVFGRFGDAAGSGMVGAHKVRSMWLIEEPTKQADVIRIHGRVPTEIRERYQEYLARKSVTEVDS